MAKKNATPAPAAPKVELTEEEKRQALFRRIDNRLENIYLASAKESWDKAMAGGGGSSPIVIQLAADDLDALEAYSRQVADVVSSVEGTRNVHTSFATGKPELQFRVKYLQPAP